MSYRLAWLPALTALLGSIACAQQPGLLDESNTAAETAPWQWFGDVMLRGNHTEDIPRPVDASFSDVFGRGRFGLAYDPIPALEFGAAIRLAASTSPNSKVRTRNFNERGNDATLDGLFLRVHANDDATFLFGEAAFPLQLSPMLWDSDLRPIGASGDLAFALNDFDRLQIVAGYFAGNHLYGDESRIAAAQVAWHWHEGAPLAGSVAASYLDFSDLEQLVAQGLSRTNRRIGTTPFLVSDYHLLDLQFAGHARAFDLPLEFRLDLVRNLGADDQRDGARGSVQIGDSRQPRSWEFGIADQRIQRDAVMAAFNSDDWWFHSWARGAMPWIAYGFSATWSARLAAFHERRDGVSEYTDRVLLDVYARW